MTGLSNEEREAAIRHKYHGLQGDMPPFGDALVLLRCLDTARESARFWEARFNEADAIYDGCRASLLASQEEAARLREEVARLRGQKSGADIDQICGVQVRPSPLLRATAIPATATAPACEPQSRNRTPMESDETTRIHELEAEIENLGDQLAQQSIDLGNAIDRANEAEERLRASPAADAQQRRALSEPNDDDKKRGASLWEVLCGETALGAVELEEADNEHVVNICAAAIHSARFSAGEQAGLTAREGAIEEAARQCTPRPDEAWSRGAQWTGDLIAARIRALGQRKPKPGQC